MNRWKWLLGIVLVFAVLRFVGIEADPPRDLTWSGALFTDEGWYANAAFRDAYGRPWYVLGDANPAVSMPLGQLIMRSAFLVHEPGLFSVRVVIAVASVLSLAIWYTVAARAFGSVGGVATALILSVSTFCFGFSRIAFMEQLGLFFVACTLLILTTVPRDRASLLACLLAALLAWCALLVKASMAFVVPAGLVLIAMRSTALKQAVLRASVFAGVAGVLTLAYETLAKQRFPADMAYFRTINLESRLVENVQDWAVNVFEKIGQTSSTLGTPLAGFVTVVILLALMKDREWRRAPLVLACFVWIVVYFSMASIINHSPPRYILTIYPALAILAGTAFARLIESRMTQSKLVMVIVFALGGVALVYEGARNLQYLGTLEYTFRDMLNEASDLSRQDVNDPLIVGAFADTVALETGIRSANSEFSLIPIETRIANGLRPTHVLLFTVTERAVAAIEAEGGVLTPVKSWDVMGNYYHEIPTELRRVTWPD